MAGAGRPDWLMPLALAVGLVGFAVGGGIDLQDGPAPPAPTPLAAEIAGVGVVVLPPQFTTQVDRIQGTLRTAVCERAGPSTTAGCYGGQTEDDTRWTVPLPRDVFKINLTLTWDASSPATEALTLEFVTADGPFRLRGPSPLSIHMAGDQLPSGTSEVAVWWAPAQSPRAKAYLDQPFVLTIATTTKTPGAVVPA